MHTSFDQKSIRAAAFDSRQSGVREEAQEAEVKKARAHAKLDAKALKTQEEASARASLSGRPRRGAT